VSVKGMTMENFRYGCECDKLSVSVSSCNEYDSVVLGDSSSSCTESGGIYLNEN
jgi:hypothetical protein